VSGRSVSDTLWKIDNATDTGQIVFGGAKEKGKSQMNFSLPKKTVSNNPLLLFSVVWSTFTSWTRFSTLEPIIAQFESYALRVKGMRLHNVDPRPHVPFTYVFTVPPGTGKTATARKIGQIFYDMGFFSAPTVLECSVSEMVGKHAGSTGPKVIDLFDKALGKVLFVDEAYRLGTKGDYAEEAVSELVDIITIPKYNGKLIVMLAGYGDDMKELLKVNRGLASRFATEIKFETMKPDQCVELLKQKVGDLNIEIEGLESEEDKVKHLFKDLAETSDWANGRDIETLGKLVTGSVFEKAASDTVAGKLAFDSKELIEIMNGVLAEKRAGGKGEWMKFYM
jgi:hypothetical protein